MPLFFDVRYFKKPQKIVLSIIIITIIIGIYFLSTTYLNTFDEKEQAIELIKRFKNAPVGLPIEQALQNYVEQLQKVGAKGNEKENILPGSWTAEKIEKGIYIVTFEHTLENNKREYIWQVWVNQGRISAFNENARQVMG